MDKQRERPARNYIQQPMPIQDVALKTYRKRWTIEKGDKRELGISVLMMRPEDDD